MSYVTVVISLLALAVAGASALYALGQSAAQNRATAIESDRGTNSRVLGHLRGNRRPGGLGDAEDQARRRHGFPGRGRHYHSGRERDRTLGPGLPPGISQEKAEAFVWGPWEFDIGASTQVLSNRQTRSRPYSLVTGKNWDVLTLSATRPGSWMAGTSTDQWRKERRQQPVRLLITCHREGHSPWLVPVEVQPERPKTARVRMIES